MKSSQKMRGRTALVTGASRGLGEAIAKCFAHHGATVGLIDLKNAWAEAAAHKIAADGGIAMGIGADVSDRDQVVEAVARFVNRFGHVDVLVNNAMWNRYERLDEIAPETLSRMVGTGIGGVIWGMQAVVPTMTLGGSIINIGSMAGRLGSAGAIAYSAIKAGLDGLTRAASVELAPKGIRVNSIAPATVLTEGVRAFMDDKSIANRIERTPLGRLAETSDIAQTALWLAGDGSSFITGQSIAVDGGIGHAFER